MKGYPYRKDKKMGVHFDSEQRIQGDEEFYPALTSMKDYKALIEYFSEAKFKTTRYGLRITAAETKRMQPDNERWPDMKHSEKAFFRSKFGWTPVIVVRENRKSYTVIMHGKKCYVDKDDIEWYVDDKQIPDLGLK